MKVNFSKPDYNWINFTLEDSGEYIFFIFSSVWYDTLEDLASSLIVLKKSFEINCNVIFFCEPEEIHFEFSKFNQIIRLSVKEITSNGNIKKNTVFEKTGDYNNICIPFWRGLRKLDTYFDKRHWDKGFPIETMELLTKLIKNKN